MWLESFVFHQIFMEKALAEYERAVRDWEEQEERQTVEFTIHEPASEKSFQMVGLLIRNEGNWEFSFSESIWDSREISVK